MKKIALYVGSWLILLALLIYPCYALLDATAKPTYDYETTYETQPRVYVTDYGEKYHNPSCHYLQSRNAKGLTEARKAGYAKGLTEARKAGYTACSYCHGTTSGTIEVAIKTMVEIPPEPTSVWDAVGTSALVSIVPALILGYCLSAKFCPKRENELPADDEFDDVDD